MTLPKFSDIDHYCIHNIGENLAKNFNALTGIQKQKSISKFNRQKLYEAALMIKEAINKLLSLDDIEDHEES